MMNRRLSLRPGFALIVAVLAVAGLARSVTAGPEDQGTKYPVGVGIGGNTVEGGILDSGGTTTISFAHAWALGLIDDNGDPVNKPDGSTTLGGTGGGSVKCHVFKGVKVKVQPKNADGSNNGEPKEITVTVFVPKKASEQDGADDKEKDRKTGSVSTKLGANVVGAKFGDSKIDLKDKSTGDPKKNERSTGWTNINAQGDQKAPVKEDDNFEDEVIQESYLPSGARFNDIPAAAFATTVPITAVSQQLAQTMHIFAEGQDPLDFLSHSVMFLSGWTDIIPDPGQPVPLQWGHATVQIPTSDGGAYAVESVRVFILPPGFITDPTLAIVGGNALIPADTHAWFDNDSDLLQIAAACYPDFTGDGALDLFDFLAYVNAFNAGDPKSDCTGDGARDLFDFLCFVNAFNSGC